MPERTPRTYIGGAIRLPSVGIGVTTIFSTKLRSSSRTSLLLLSATKPLMKGDCCIKLISACSGQLCGQSKQLIGEGNFAPDALLLCIDMSILDRSGGATT
jgi:hypothetical protein